MAWHGMALALWKMEYLEKMTVMCQDDELPMSSCSVYL